MYLFLSKLSLCGYNTVTFAEVSSFAISGAFFARCCLMDGLECHVCVLNHQKLETLGKRAYDRACGLEWTYPFPTLIPWPCQFWNVIQKWICYEHEYISTFPCLFFQKEHLCHSSSSPSDDIYIYTQTPAIINSFERNSRINFVRSTHTQPQQPRPECWMLKGSKSWASCGWELLVKLVGFLPIPSMGKRYICLYLLDLFGKCR